MYPLLATITILSLRPVIAALCPIYGPTFPYPKNLANSAIVQSALQNLTNTINADYAAGNSSHGPVDPASGAAIQIFSLEDQDSPLYEYYHDGTLLANSTGVKTINGDSIFRIGSVAKLLTVYLVLAELGDGVWTIPITEALPELRNRTRSLENPIDYVRWDDITLGGLASHVAGVARDFVSFEDFDADPAQFGLPPSPSEQPACTYTRPCDRRAFFEGLDTRQPTYLPNTTPVYSNTGFLLLSYALESLTGKSYRDILQAIFIDQLEMTRTSYDAPDESQGVIPNGTEASDWYFDVGDGTPMGGIYSSVNDLSKFGRAILNSTIIDKNTTRAWLKPAAFTSDIRGAVGRPWEIFRVDTLFPDRVVDIYTKAGDIGLYHTFIATIPDYNIGFTVAIAGTGDHSWIDGLIVDIVVPALDATAMEQTNAAYAGTFRPTSDLNTSLTLTTEAGKPGLGIQNWISNGTDVVGYFQNIASSRDVRVLPTSLERGTGAATQVAWRAVPDLSRYSAPGPFSACVSWFAMDIAAYGRYPYDQLIFNLDQNGDAVSVTLRAFNITLERQR